MTNEVTFIKLSADHFPLIHQWFQEPHVWQWWGENKKWSMQDIEEKYTTYLKGFKINPEGETKPIHPYIIVFQGHPIGYIQYYNLYDFPRTHFDVFTMQKDFPESLGALDFYIGEVGKGIGAEILKKFLGEHVYRRFTACLVDPLKNNKSAIKAYAKAGFSTHHEFEAAIIMIARKNPEVNPIILVGSSKNDGDIMSAVKMVIHDNKIPIIDLNTKSISYFDYEHKNKGDDFIPLAEVMVKHNPIILATPVYWYTMSAVMKTFIDRWSDLLEIRKDIGRRLAGKDLYVVTSYASDFPRSFEEPFAQICGYLEMNYKGCFYFYTGENPQILAKNGALAEEFSKKIFLQN